MMRMLNAAKFHSFALTRRKTHSCCLTSQASITPSSFEDDAISLCRNGRLHDAIDLIQSFSTQASRPNVSVYLCILQKCSALKSLIAGQRAHAAIVRDALESDNNRIGNLLIEMYAKCGTPDDAYGVFNLLRHKDIQSWHMMITAYTLMDRGKEAFLLLQQMHAKQLIPDTGTLMNVIHTFSSPSSIEDAKAIHAFMVDNSLIYDIVIRNALITMYGKCGSSELAHDMFIKMPERDVVSWTAIISVFTKNGHGKEAMEYFAKMLKDGIKPDRVTFISLIEACANLAFLEDGQLIHTQMIENGLQIDVFVGTALLNMYGKCGCISSAKYVFHTMQERNVVTWNAMITACAQNKLSDETLEVFWKMQQDNEKVNKVSFVGALNACSKPEYLTEAKVIHQLMIETGIDSRSDVVVGSVLVTMYGECGSLRDAERAFSQLIKKNVISWTALLSLYVEHGQTTEALKLFSDMQRQGLDPNHVTFLTLLDACTDPKFVTLGEVIYSMIVENGVKLDSFLKTSLVIMYGKCGKLQDADRIFASIQPKNVVLYTAMIAAYSQWKHGKEALQMFARLNNDGIKPDNFTFSASLDAVTSLSSLIDGKLIHHLIVEVDTELEIYVETALVNMYGKCAALDDGKLVFNKMHSHSVVSFNSLIAAYGQHQQGDLAFDLYLRMQCEGLTPDHVTYISTLDACAGLIDLVQVKALHVDLIGSGIARDLVMETALLNLYSKCGDFNGASKIFEDLPKRDVASWNAMIAAYSQHGHGKEVVKLFKRMIMEGIKPDEVTFVSVLSACSRAGLVKEGKEYFDSMAETYRIIPAVEHYACMADVYGRAGLLLEAEKFLKKMPNHPNPVAWLTLLSACKVHCDMERAKYAASRVFELDVKHAGARMTLANMFAVAGNWDDAVDIIQEIT